MMKSPGYQGLRRIVLAAILLLACQPAFAEKRVALVLGNSAYQNVAKLPNPVKDGAVMAATLKDAGFDATQPSAWIAEGLFGYLPPEAQDRLLDAVTELGAPGSRLASEAVPNMADFNTEEARQRIQAATAKWRDHGFELDFSELGFEGERNDVGEHLDGRGWQFVGTPMSELLVTNGFPAIPQPDDEDQRMTMNGVVYYTSTLR